MSNERAPASADPTVKRDSSGNAAWEGAQVRVSSNGKRGKIRALIVGCGTAGRRLAERLEERSQYEVVGFLDDGDDGVCADMAGVLGGRDDVMRIVDEFAIQEVFVVHAPSWQQRLAENLVNGHPKLRVKVVPSLYETMIAKPRFRTIDDVPLLDVTAPTGLSYPSRIVKRVADVLVSTVMLVVTSPVMIGSAIAVRATTPGPVFFRQDRVGRNGEIFRVIKFRTMYRDAEAQTGPVLSSGQDDARVTKVGRFLRRCRMDELPQFLNVLLGHMSVVGPRPERPVFVDRFCQDIVGYGERHKVRPGITGLAQVYGTYRTDPHLKQRYDMMYVYNQSLWLDAKILTQTMAEMLTGAGS